MSHRAGLNVFGESVLPLPGFETQTIHPAAQALCQQGVGKAGGGG
jgi:hypothetical protein